MNWKIRCIAVSALCFTSPGFAQAPTAVEPGVEPTAEALVDPTAVAVLPVDIRSADPRYAQLAAALYNEFVGQLKMADGIQVINAGRVEAYASSSLAPEAIGRQLGAATVVQSSVNARAKAYEVRYAIVDTRKGGHFASGVMQSQREWTTHGSLDDRIRSAIADAAESVELRVYPERHSAFERDAARAQAKARFLDVNLPAHDRLAALNKLKPPGLVVYPHRYADGGDSLTGDIAIAAAQLATDSDDPTVRITIWQTMTGVDDPNLIEPLLFALANDVDARVRAKAADALAIHKALPAVRESLDRAAAEDADRRVRMAAKLAVATAEQQRALVRLTVMDPDVPESERNVALATLLTINFDDPRPADTELVSSLVDLAQSSTRRRTQSLAWATLGEMGGAAAVESLLEALASEEDERLRETLVESLSRYLDEPGVRAVLMTTQADDRSPLVRQAAECALQADGWC